jgi:hypothetical protein
MKNREGLHMKFRTVSMAALLLCVASVFSCGSTMKAMGLKKKKFDPNMAASRNMEVLKSALDLSEQQEKDLYQLQRRYYKSLLSDLKDYEDRDIDGHELEVRASVLGFKTVRKAQQMLTPPQFEKYRKWAKQEGIIK